MEHIKYDQDGEAIGYLSHNCILNEYKDYLENISFMLQLPLDNILGFLQNH